MSLTKHNNRSLSGSLIAGQVSGIESVTSGNVIRMGSTKLSTYGSANATGAWSTCDAFGISGITAGNTVYLTLSINDLVEGANSVYWRILTDDSTNLGQHGRQTNPNGGWRGIRSDITVHDYQTGGGTREYTLQFYGTGSTWYYNYPSGDTDCASFLTWYEIKA